MDHGEWRNYCDGREQYWEDVCKEREQIWKDRYADLSRSKEHSLRMWIVLSSFISGALGAMVGMAAKTLSH